MDKFGALSQGFRLHYAKFFHQSFLFTRLAVTSILIFLFHQPGLQSILISVLLLANSAYYIKYRPCDSLFEKITLPLDTIVIANCVMILQIL